MRKTNAEIVAQIKAGQTTLGIEYGSTRIKAVLDDADNEPIAVGTYDWENSYEGGYWTYPQKDLLVGLAGAYASLKTAVRECYGVTLHRVGARHLRHDARLSAL